ncbi:MAG: hypothetical protein U1F46_01495 [Marinagarivorans sp.]
MTHLVAKTIALTALSVAITACGSGKDASAKSSNTNNEPVVVDQRAVGITEDNLETVLATAFEVTTQAGPGSNDANQPRPVYMQGNLGDGLSNMANAQANSTIPDAATGIDFQASKAICSQGGTASGTVGLDTANLGANGITDFLKLYVDFSFGECKTALFWLNGKATVSLSSQSGILSNNNDSTLLIKLGADLKRFYVAQPTKNGKQVGRSLDITGKVEFSISNPERKYIRAELNGVPGSSLMFYEKGKTDQLVQLNEFESYLQSSMVDGSYSVGVKGSMVSMGKATSNSKSLPTSRLKIYTDKTITGQGFAVPHDGILVVETENEIARFEILNQVDLKYTLDKKKDGTIDYQVDTTWADFISEKTGLKLD